MDGVILIVEPELPVRQPLANYLRECGYKVFEAINTDEALIVLTAEEISVDIVMCDAHCSGEIDGFGLAQWVRGNAPDIQILLAASVERVAEQAGTLCKDGPHLTKPYHHQTLVDHIRQLLAQRDRTRASCQ
ncbi:hypothetical protein BH09PSE3_BH09PSE3_28100 [soil metagenome]